MILRGLRPEVNAGPVRRLESDEIWSRRSDSNRGPSAYRADALAGLSYGGVGAGEENRTLVKALRVPRSASELLRQG